MHPTAIIPAVLAACLLAACQAPDPELPDDPPTPQAEAATPDVAAQDAPTPAQEAPMQEQAPLGTDNPTWREAAERGVAFRALGQEPGWYVEVGGSEPPTLHAVLDYGERTLDVAAVEVPADGHGYRGTTADGTEVVVHVEDLPCQDIMSGHRFPATVELSVGGDTYRGCGAHL